MHRLEGPRQVGNGFRPALGRGSLGSAVRGLATLVFIAGIAAGLSNCQGEAKKKAVENNKHPGTTPVKATALYAIDFSAAGQVFQFSVGSDGSLTQIAPAVPAGSNPTDIVVEPTHRYAYVTNINDGDISQYKIASNGALTANSPATVAFSTGTAPSAITANPSGNQIYVTDDNNPGAGVGQFDIGTGGTLSAMTPASVDVNVARMEAIAVDPTGTFAYAGPLAPTSSVFYQHALTSGKLAATPTNITSNMTGVHSIAIHPTGKYLYAVASGATIAQFSINAGTVAPLSPATVTAGVANSTVIVHPSGKYVYVLDDVANDVEQYTVNTNGTLAPMTPSTVACDTGPVGIAVDPAGKFLYVSGGTSGNKIGLFTVGSTGGLTKVGTSLSVSSGVLRRLVVW